MKRKIDNKENEQFLFNIIVPIFNAEKYIVKCLSSIAEQSYKNFQVKVIDDCSSDSSYELASLICAKHENFDIYRNKQRLGKLNNISELLGLKVKEPSRTIDIELDGDDYLFSKDVLDFLNELYLKSNCLITYGSFLTSQGVQGKRYPKWIRKFNLYRKYFWYASHLKTFRHDLWLSINPNDLLDKNGHYFQCATDLAIMFPMLEMAGSRQEFVKKILYFYNSENPISNHNVRRRKQIAAGNEIRKKKRYKIKSFV